MAVSVFDIFKVGIGPSSSHTVGPMRAARLFAERLVHQNLLSACVRVEVKLYGSLGSTGKGHGTDKAVLLGLEGHDPESVDVEAIPTLLAAIRESGQLRVAGQQPVVFKEKDHLAFYRRETLPFHPNGMRCIAYD
ncbi:MAG TPA: serine dehydratase beta chain, partial [Rhodoferax sp.]